MSAAISINNISKKFPRTSGYRDLLPFRHRKWVEAVKNVSLEIKEGEFFGMLGPNGAGKTTLIKMLCCLVLPNSGTARIFGHDIIKDTPVITGHGTEGDTHQSRYTHHEETDLEGRSCSPYRTVKDVILARSCAEDISLAGWLCLRVAR